MIKPLFHLKEILIYNIKICMQSQQHLKGKTKRITSRKPKIDPQKCVYIAISLLWQQKSQKGQILGVFESEKDAISCIKHAKGQCDLQHKSQNQTFFAKFNPGTTAQSDIRLSFTIYIVVPMETNRQDICVAFSYKVQFPNFLFCKKGQNKPNSRFSLRMKYLIYSYIQVQSLKNPSNLEISHPPITIIGRNKGFCKLIIQKNYLLAQKDAVQNHNKSEEYKQKHLVDYQHDKLQQQKQKKQQQKYQKNQKQ